ncbi:MAG: carboxymuconolactone decarboxylase family protein, partial [Acidimicrobiaceae bacterium]|nr:carboxymuconolactone decarboxylase family protein [Acidimicrobiaceae bacterium]
MTSPKINIPAVPPGQDAAMYINSRTDPTLFGAYMQFYVAAKELPPVDPELIELLRLRNGVAQSCQYCLSVRMEGGY